MLHIYLDRWLEYGRARFYGLTIGGGIVLCVLSSWLWWHYVYLNPQNVFWGAFNNNLIVHGVTKHTVSQTASGTLDEYDQIGLGAHNIVRSVGVMSQPATNDRKNMVVTESIGTPTANFARYTKIDTQQLSAQGKPLDFSGVLHVWSKQDVSKGGNGAFAEAIFAAIPFSYLNQSQRQQVIQTVQHEDTYGIDFAHVQKKRDKGHLYYLYDAALAPDKYVQLLKQVDSLMGLHQLNSLDPSQYQGGQPIQLKIMVDASAHQLASVTYVGNNRVEAYSGWGVAPSPSLPSQTISQAELQTKLNALMNGQ